MNTTHDERFANPEYERQGFAEYRKWLDSGIPDPDPVYANAVHNAGSMDDKTFSITSHGLIALTPKIAQLGDYVGILSGFRLPVVLRKVGPPEQRCYELLGACYLHRMMRGRVWSLIEEFKCKYRPGLEDETPENPPSTGSSVELPDSVEACETFPFNAKGDYARVVRILGSRRIVLV